MTTHPGAHRPRIGITLGDPRGIGAEVTLEALREDSLRARTDFILIGPEDVIPAGLGLQLESVGQWSGGGVAAAGRLAGLAVARATAMALEGVIDALVTAPIEKSAFHAGGWHFPGHTEMLRELTGVADVAMMMASEETQSGGPLRVVLATTHLALRDVPKAFTARLLESQVKLTGDGLERWWGISAPRIALCAFNPHASDGGLFGDEERRIYEPAIAALRATGMQLFGPVPADTVFRRAIDGQFDAVVAPYHDVGMAAFKTAAFGSGVNVTLGLPFPRTSPDHGTALDIAGQGLADPSSMIEAIRLAIRMVDVSPNHSGKARSFDTGPDPS